MKTQPLDIAKLGEFIVDCGYGVSPHIEEERTVIHYLYLIAGQAPEYPWLNCERQLGINPIAMSAGFHQMMLLIPDSCEKSLQCYILGKALRQYIDSKYPGWLEGFCDVF